MNPSGSTTLPTNGEGANGTPAVSVKRTFSHFLPPANASMYQSPYLRNPTTKDSTRVAKEADMSYQGIDLTIEATQASASISWQLVVQPLCLVFALIKPVNPTLSLSFYLSVQKRFHSGFKKISFVRNLPITVKSSPRVGLTRSNTSSSSPVQILLRSAAFRTLSILAASMISVAGRSCPIIRF